MAWTPKFRLYASNGSSLIYTFPVVQFTNAPHSNKKTVFIEGLRGIGGIVIEGAEEAWDLEIRFILLDDNYEDLTTKIEAVENTILTNTRYYLKIDKTSTTYFEYKVKRITPIEYTESLRTDYQEVRITFRVNSW
jgi:hypothetical protein